MWSAQVRPPQPPQKPKGPGPITKILFAPTIDGKRMFRPIYWFRNLLGSFQLWRFSKNMEVGLFRLQFLLTELESNRFHPKRDALRCEIRQILQFYSERVDDLWRRSLKH